MNRSYFRGIKAELPEEKEMADINYIRGIVERFGAFKYRYCKIINMDLPSDFDTIVREKEGDFLIFKGVNAIDFMGKLYDNCGSLNRRERIYNEYLYWFTHKTVPTCKYILNNTHAVAPTKIRASDEGFDLWIIKIEKHISHNSVLYDTGVILTPPPGWHFEILARSSLCKTGYILANSIGLIDENYTGCIKICLIKVSDDKPDLELPFKAVQAVLRPSVHYTFEKSNNFEETSRGNGGFGSTDIN